MSTLRTMHKRRKRKLMIAAQPCAHTTVEEYADGAYCPRCGAWFESRFWEREYDEYDCDRYENDDDGESGECYWCAGEGFVDGHEEDAIFYTPGEMIRCSSCNGTGLAKDMTIW